MKTNKFLSIILSIALVASLQLGAAIPAFADDPTTLTTNPEKNELTEIYIDPSKGKDENSGTADSPVKTFEAARALAAANESITTIYAKGTISASGEWDLNLGEGREVVLKRAPGFTSSLISVYSDKELTLSNIVIDGDETQNNSSTLIRVSGKLVMNEGTVLQNNIKVDNWYGEGGAVRVEEGGTFIMNDGVIQGCQTGFGGGVATFGDFTMNGGTIKDNKAYHKSADTDSEAILYSSGGGVGVGNKGVMYFNGGTISNNMASNDGGGIALGDYYVRYVEKGNPSLFMSGGQIEDNTAGANGGGIFVQANGRAKIAGGAITRNEALARTATSMFSGGGIYVNGGYEPSYANGKLELINPIIKNNTAYGSGGGIANCPSGGYVIRVNNGGAIFDNASSNGRSVGDLYALSGVAGNHRGYPRLFIASHMLGGGDYNWKYSANDEIFTLTDKTIRVKTNTPDYYVDIYSTVSEEDKEKAEQKAREEGGVWITENIGRRNGGGIGSNGNVYVGTDDTFSGKLKVTKKVNSAREADLEKEFTFRVTLDQYIKDGTYGATDENPGMTFEKSTATFTLKNGESIVATDLPDAARFTVEELDADGFIVVSEGETGQFLNPDNTYEAVFTNTLKHTKVQVSKQAIFGGEAKELPGATLTVRDAEGNVVKDVLTGEELTWTSGEEPHEVALVPGDYILTEDAAPAGYDIVQEVSFTINEDYVLEVGSAGDGVQVNGSKIILTDSLKPYEVLISKLDAANSEELEGAELTIMGTDKDGNAIESISWVSTGEAHNVSLPAGTYTLIEDQAPLGYQRAESITFVVDEHGVVTVGGKDVEGRVVMLDKPEGVEDSKVVVRKVDEEGNPLAGAWFGIEKKTSGADGAVYIPVGPTDENGYAVVETYMPEEKYVIYEVEAPEGYILDETVYDVVFDADGVFTITVVNKKKPEEPPVIEEPPTPNEPGKPEEPTTPEEPEKPTTPEEPKVPNNPATPEEPEKPSTPEQPKVPEQPTTKTSNPTPTTSTTTRSGKLPVTADAVTGMGLAGLVGLAMLGAAGVWVSRKRRRD